MSREGLNVFELGFADDDSSVVSPVAFAATPIAQLVSPVPESWSDLFSNKVLPGLVQAHLSQFFDPFLDSVKPFLEQSKEELAAMPDDKWRGIVSYFRENADWLRYIEKKDRHRVLPFMQYLVAIKDMPVLPIYLTGALADSYYAQKYEEMPSERRKTLEINNSDNIGLVLAGMLHASGEQMASLPSFRVLAVASRLNILEQQLFAKRTFFLACLALDLVPLPVATYLFTTASGCASLDKLCLSYALIAPSVIANFALFNMSTFMNVGYRASPKDFSSTRISRVVYSAAFFALLLCLPVVFSDHFSSNDFAAALPVVVQTIFLTIPKLFFLDCCKDEKTLLGQITEFALKYTHSDFWKKISEMEKMGLRASGLEDKNNMEESPVATPAVNHCGVFGAVRSLLMREAPIVDSLQESLLSPV
jgi:hypothetical protein